MVMDGGKCGGKRWIFHREDEVKSARRRRRGNGYEPILRGMEINQGA